MWNKYFYLQEKVRPFENKKWYKSTSGLQPGIGHVSSMFPWVAFWLRDHICGRTNNPANRYQISNWRATRSLVSSYIKNIVSKFNHTPNKQGPQWDKYIG